MPYDNISSLPSSVRKVLPVSGQKMFLSAFNSAYAKHGEIVAFKIAWGVVKQKFKKSGKTYVALSTDFKPKELFVFELKPKSEILISNSDDGEILLDAVLADTDYNRRGLRFYEEDLQSLADQINSNGSTLPDAEHAVLKSVQEKYFNTKDLVKEVTRTKGVFKKIKAVVENGKLWIQALLDKRYKNYVEKFKSLSIEAIATQDGDRASFPKYLGFTFTNTPQLPNAMIAM